eukprot:6206529-Pleurochrysis_carterae.AAC.1
MRPERCWMSCADGTQPRLSRPAREGRHGSTRCFSINAYGLKRKDEGTCAEGTRAEAAEGTRAEGTWAEAAEGTWAEGTWAKGTGAEAAEG